jgi:DNA repair protein RadA
MSVDRFGASVEKGELGLKDLVGQTKYALLRRKGIETIDEFLMYNPEDLVELGIWSDPITAARHLRRAEEIRRKIMGMSAKEWMIYKRSLPTLPTGVESIDELLDGGLKPRAIYEFAGEFGTGKTQLCHQLCITVQLEPINGKAIYIDCEETFSAKRIETIAKRFGVDGDKALENIYLKEVDTVFLMEEFVRKYAPKMMKEGYKLIIIDPLMGLYRAQMSGIDKLASQRHRVNAVLSWILRYIRQYEAYSAITNQVTTAMLPGGIAKKIPYGGTILEHQSQHRFMLRYIQKQKVWLFEVYESPDLERGKSAMFRITDHGLVNAK